MLQIAAYLAYLRTLFHSLQSGDIFGATNKCMWFDAEGQVFTSEPVMYEVGFPKVFHGQRQMSIVNDTCVAFESFSPEWYFTQLVARCGSPIRTGWRETSCLKENIYKCRTDCAFNLIPRYKLYPRQVPGTCQSHSVNICMEIWRKEAYLS